MHSLLIAAVLTLVAAQDGAAPSTVPSTHPTDTQIATWYKFRQSKYLELKAADPDQAAEIAAVKARTAAAVAVAGPLATSLDAPPIVWPTGRASPLILYEDAAAPRMAVVPAGEFTMGPSAAEPGPSASAGPRRRVRIAQPLAVGLFPVVYGEYALFVADTHHPSGGQCADPGRGGTGRGGTGRDWRDAGFSQTVRHPAICVGFADAQAYAAWVSAKTGHRYRLLSEAEGEWIERAGTTTAYSWGEDASAACAYANGLDQDGGRDRAGATPIACHDGYAFTAPAGSFRPNAFGLFDTAGNVWSWTADCWTKSLSRAPTDGAASRQGECGRRVVRGGSWASADLRAAVRDGAPVGHRTTDRGFRLARDL